MTEALVIFLVLAALLLGLALAWTLSIAALDRFVLAHLALQEGMSVVDVGCGDGRLSLQIAKRVGPNGAVFGIDMRPWRIRRAVQRAQKAFAGQVHFTHAAVGEGGISALHVDRAVLVTVLGEMADSPAALVELFQALKPGGMVGITEVILDPHYQNRAHVRALAEAAGFHIDACPGNWLAFTMLVSKPEQA
jgi:ubiquinone/menaquinone biosynthesis C-methylase UbiE